MVNEVCVSEWASRRITLKAMTGNNVVHCSSHKHSFTLAYLPFAPI